MIVVIVGDQDEIDPGQRVESDTGRGIAAHADPAAEGSRPVGPGRIGQEGDPVELDQDRGVTDPGHGRLAVRRAASSGPRQRARAARRGCRRARIRRRGGRRSAPPPTPDGRRGRDCGRRSRRAAPAPDPRSRSGRERAAAETSPSEAGAAPAIRASTSAGIERFTVRASIAKSSAPTGNRRPPAGRRYICSRTGKERSSKTRAITPRLLQASYVTRVELARSRSKTSSSFWATWAS